MKWLINIYDPKLPKAKEEIFIKSKRLTREDYLNWLSDKLIGEPKATYLYSVKELKEMNMVGIYSLD